MSEERDEFTEHINKDTMYDGIRTCIRCGRELTSNEFGFCEECDEDD